VGASGASSAAGANGSGAPGTAGTGNTNTGNGGSNPGGGSGVGGNGTAGQSAGGTGVDPGGVPAAALLPARIRRLSNAEYDGSVQALLGSPLAPGEGFAPDARQDGYTVNDAQRVDNVTAKQIAAAALALSSEARAKVMTLAPCADATPGEACAKTFIASFGQRAYRRPLSGEEAQGLLTVYGAGAEGAAYADGIALVVRAVLQSAGFLYLTELGDAGTPAPGTAFALTPHELASSLAYLITAAPPDEQLLSDALAGKLTTPEGRVVAAQRLLTSPLAKERVVRVVREWLGTDRIGEIDKDSNVYPQFSGLKAQIETESLEFPKASIFEGTGSLQELLSADWTRAEASLATFYGSSGSGKVSLSKRRGILNQAAFLSVHAHATESGPVLRGVVVGRRLACLPIPSPISLNIMVTPPVPDPTKTTRERFAIHSADAACAACHTKIDPFGFSFEAFDGMGNARTTDANKPVDSKVSVAVGLDFDGSYADSNALSVALAESASVRSCFARHVFRASAGRSDASVQASEEAFLASWQALPPDSQGKVLDTLLTLVKSPLFSHRRAQ
jgi:hypothetical protein